VLQNNCPIRYTKYQTRCPVCSSYELQARRVQATTPTIKLFAVKVVSFSSRDDSTQNHSYLGCINMWTNWSLMCIVCCI